MATKYTSVKPCGCKLVFTNRLTTVLCDRHARIAKSDLKVVK